MLFYGVVSDSTAEAVELFTSREEAEAIVEAWDRDEARPSRCAARRADRVQDVAELGLRRTRLTSRVRKRALEDDHVAILLLVERLPH